MPSRKIEFCVQVLREAWEYGSKEFAQRHADDPQPFLTCTYRSNAEQAELYAQGRTKPGKVVTQIARNGKHNSNPAKAFDIAFKNESGALDWSPALFEKFAAILAEKYPSVEWGGKWKKFKDRPHFQV